MAQELMALSDKVGQRRAYWSRPNNGAEIDFIYIYDSRIIPVEVKNGTNAHLRSIQVFIDMSPEDIVIRIWSGNYSVDTVTPLMQDIPPCQHPILSDRVHKRDIRKKLIDGYGDRR